jgi:hypothetical protein
LRIALAPHQVAMVRLSRGPNPRVTYGNWLPASESARPNWSGPIDTLRALLADPVAAGTHATVILSNHFVRYQVLSWSTELVTQAEETEYARARFVEIYGEAARDWVIRTGSAAPGAGRLAAAADRALIDTLAQALDALGVKFVSCQPALMAQFNGARTRIGDDAWLVSAERTRLAIARIVEGRWHSVRTRPVNGAPVALRELLEQERLLLPAGATDDRIFLSVVDDVAVDTEGLQLERLVARRNARLAPEVDAGVALALAGVS